MTGYQGFLSQLSSWKKAVMQGFQHSEIGNASVEWVVLTASVIILVSLFMYGIWGENGERGIMVTNMITEAYDAFKQQPSDQP